MKKTIVITSIFEPTEAISKFAEYKDYELVVVGDKKTPANWSKNNTTFLSIERQKKSGFSLVQVLPYNHYCRKMIGYLYSMQNGAEYIVDTDDDNIPKDNWGFPDFNGKYNIILPDLGFINIYQLFTNENVWPRGLPLKSIPTNFELEKKIKIQNNCNVGIWQGLADEDPDVDAIYRLTNNKECIFNEREPIVLGKGTLSPFNTQNTIFRKELFPLLYLPTSVTFRFTDILRGLIAQPIMWQYGFQLGFTKATVLQKRNPHDYYLDFISEIPMYINVENVIEIVNNVITPYKNLNDNLYNVYLELKNNGIVQNQEIDTLESWLKDIGKFNV